MTTLIIILNFPRVVSLMVRRYRQAGTIWPMKEQMFPDPNRPFNLSCWWLGHRLGTRSYYDCGGLDLWEQKFCHQCYANEGHYTYNHRPVSDGKWYITTKAWPGEVDGVR